MGVNKNRAHWLNKNHPNYKRWERARKISLNRGRFVSLILSKIINCKGLKILDLGSGEGGTSQVLSEENRVISSDINKTRLLGQSVSNSRLQLICSSSSYLPFNKKSFDVIILQDVLEHLDDRDRLIDNLYNLLNDNGIIYLSTPNKLSLINIIADPHWGVPFISLIKRDSINKYFLKQFRRSETVRKDIAELLSLNSLNRLFVNKFELILFTKMAANELFRGNKGIIWSKLHLGLNKFLQSLKLDKIILKIANDDNGFLNNYLTPTFYIILKKKRK